MSNNTSDINRGMSSLAKMFAPQPNFAENNKADSDVEDFQSVIAPSIEDYQKYQIKLDRFWHGIHLGLSAIDEKSIKLATLRKQLPKVNKLDYLNEISSQYLFAANGPRKIAWDILMGVLICYSMVIIPLEIGFDLGTALWQTVIDWTITAFFGLDIFIQFNTAYIDPQTEKWVINRRDIAKHYLIFWLWIDLLATIPFDIIFDASGLISNNNLTEYKAIRMIRFFRMVRIVKIYRVLKIKELLEQYIHPALLNLCLLLLQIFYIAHIFACFWYYIALPINSSHEKNTWITNPYYKLALTTVTEQYISAIYFIVITFLTIGYGDIYPTNDIERIYSMIAMFTGVIVISTLVGKVAAILIERNQEEQEHRKRMTSFRDNLADKGLSLMLIERAKSAYSYYLYSKATMEEERIYADLPKSIQKDLVCKLFNEDIKKFLFFRLVDSSVLVDIVLHMRPGKGLSNEILYEEEDYLEDFLFIQEGWVEMSVEIPKPSRLQYSGYNNNNNNNNNNMTQYNSYHNNNNNDHNNNSSSSRLEGHGGGPRGGLGGGSTGGGGFHRQVVGLIQEGGYLGDCEWVTKRNTAWVTYSVSSYCSFFALSYSVINRAFGHMSNVTAYQELHATAMERAKKLRYVCSTAIEKRLVPARKFTVAAMLALAATKRSSFVGGTVAATAGSAAASTASSKQPDGQGQDGQEGRGEQQGQHWMIAAVPGKIRDSLRQYHALPATTAIPYSTIPSTASASSTSSATSNNNHHNNNNLLTSVRRSSVRRASSRSSASSLGQLHGHGHHHGHHGQHHHSPMDDLIRGVVWIDGTLIDLGKEVLSLEPIRNKEGAAAALASGSSGKGGNNSGKEQAGDAAGAVAGGNEEETIMVDVPQNIHPLTYRCILHESSSNSSSSLQSSSHNNNHNNKHYNISNSNSSSSSSSHKPKVVLLDLAQIHSRGIIFPLEPHKLLWDVLIAICVIISVLWIPAALAFYSSGSVADDDNYSHVSLGLTMDAFFILDIACQFRTAFFDKRHDAYVITQSDIAWHFILSGWFALDVLSTIPFEIFVLFPVTGSSSSSSFTANLLLRLVRIFRVFRIARILKVDEYIDRLESLTGIPVAFFSLISLFTRILFIAHWMTCLWWGLTNVLEAEPWYTRYTDDVQPLIGELKTATPMAQYLISFYFIVATITTVGYGDIHATDASERVVALLLGVLGVMVFGYMLSNISSIVGSLTTNDDSFKERIANVRSYLEAKKCPEQLQSFVLDQYQRKLKELSNDGIVDAVKYVPPMVARQILYIVYASRLKKIALFAYLPNASIQLYLFQKMIPVVCEEGYHVLKEGKQAKEISFLLSGQAISYRTTMKREQLSKHVAASKTTVPVVVRRGSSVAATDTVQANDNRIVSGIQADNRAGPGGIAGREQKIDETDDDDDDNNLFALQQLRSFSEQSSKNASSVNLAALAGEEKKADAEQEQLQQSKLPWQARSSSSGKPSMKQLALNMVLVKGDQPDICRASSSISSAVSMSKKNSSNPLDIVRLDKLLQQGQSQLLLQQQQHSPRRVSSKSNLHNSPTAAAATVAAASAKAAGESPTSRKIVTKLTTLHQLGNTLTLASKAEAAAAAAANSSSKGSSSRGRQGEEEDDDSHHHHHDYHAATGAGSGRRGYPVRPHYPIYSFLKRTFFASKHEQAEQSEAAAQYADQQAAQQQPQQQPVLQLSVTARRAARIAALQQEIAGMSASQRLKYYTRHYHPHQQAQLLPSTLQQAAHQQASLTSLEELDAIDFQHLGLEYLQEIEVGEFVGQAAFFQQEEVNHHSVVISSSAAIIYSLSRADLLTFLVQEPMIAMEVQTALKKTIFQQMINQDLRKMTLQQKQFSLWLRCQFVNHLWSTIPLVQHLTRQQQQLQEEEEAQRAAAARLARLQAEKAALAEQHQPDMHQLQSKSRDSHDANDHHQNKPAPGIELLSASSSRSSIASNKRGMSSAVLVAVTPIVQLATNRELRIITETMTKLASIQIMIGPYDYRPAYLLQACHLQCAAIHKLQHEHVHQAAQIDQAGKATSATTCSYAKLAARIQAWDDLTFYCSEMVLQFAKVSRTAKLKKRSQRLAVLSQRREEHDSLQSSLLSSRQRSKSFSKYERLPSSMQQTVPSSASSSSSTTMHVAASYSAPPVLTKQQSSSSSSAAAIAAASALSPATSVLSSFTSPLKRPKSARAGSMEVDPMQWQTFHAHLAAPADYI